MSYLNLHAPFKINCYVLAMISLLVVNGDAIAQAANTPDAGSLLREIERNQVKPIPPVIPKPEIKKEKDITKTEATVFVKEIRFEGNEKISTSDLKTHYEKYLNQKLTVSEIENLAAEIAVIYSDKGFVAQGQLPRQDVTDGVITIRVFEAKFGGSVLDEEQKKKLTRIQPEQLQKIVGQQLMLGEAVNVNQLDRALLIADDLPGVAVQGSLMAGEKEGESLVLLQAENEPLFYGDAALDNHGSRATGPFKQSANLGLASPLSIGDQLNLSLLHTQGTNYGRLAYSVPLGYDGVRVGMSASQMGYKVITPESQSTKPKGQSGVLGVDLQYPIIRSRSENLYLSAAYDMKNFKNEYIKMTAYETSSDYGVHVFSVGLSGNQYDGFNGGGMTSASLNIGIGHVDLTKSVSEHQINDAASVRTAGDYSRLRWSLSRSQAIMSDLTLMASASGQKASKNLDSSEKFYLGGPVGIRAYPNSEGAGSEGQMINLELRQKLPQNLMVSAFYDWGRVKQYANNNKVDGNLISSINAYNLSGYGLTLAWDGPYKTNVKAIWARRIGNNPYPTASGNDQDGSLKRDRFWLTASIPF